MYAGSSGSAWEVDFSYGRLSEDEVGKLYRARCVRGARCYPKNRFTVLDGGLVRDELTGLVWQQRESTIEMTWADAQNYCSSGFRLPTLKELLSLVDITVTSGATINQAAFPKTPTESFWSSSPYAGRSGPRWHVNFGYGYSSFDDASSYYRVRCVR
jgi:hypothetical protein